MEEPAMPATSISPARSALTTTLLLTTIHWISSPSWAKYPERIPPKSGREPREGGGGEALRLRIGASEIALLAEVFFCAGMKRDIQLTCFAAAAELDHRHRPLIEMVDGNFLMAKIDGFGHVVSDRRW